MYPRRSQTVYTEQLGEELSIYDWARNRVHALNPTAARVWQLCDGVTSPEAIAAALHRDIAVRDAEAVVDLTLRSLARAHLLEAPRQFPAVRPGWTRRALLRRGVATGLLPAIHSIAAPPPASRCQPAATIASARGRCNTRTRQAFAGVSSPGSFAP
jgi:hypothetical protein